MSIIMIMVLHVSGYYELTNELMVLSVCGKYQSCVAGKEEEEEEEEEERDREKEEKMVARNTDD